MEIIMDNWALMQKRYLHWAHSQLYVVPFKHFIQRGKYDGYIYIYERARRDIDECIWSKNLPLKKKSDQRVASISHACSRLLISEADVGPKASTLVPLSLSRSSPLLSLALSFSLAAVEDVMYS